MRQQADRFVVTVLDPPEPDAWPEEWRSEWRSEWPDTSCHRLPTLAMGLDLSPMVVILALYFLKEFLVPVLHRLAMEIG